MRDLSILHLGKNYWPDRGGMETALSQMATAAWLDGARVECWVSQSRGPSAYEAVFGIPIRRLASWGLLWSTPIAPAWFGKMAQIPRWKVIHIHLPNPLAELALALSLLFFKKRNAVIPYFHAFPISQGWLGRFWFSMVTRYILQKADRILVSSLELKKIFPVLETWSQKLRVMPFATRIFLPNSEVWLNRKAKRTVISVGRLVSYKGYADLVEAWAQIPSMDRRDWRLKIVGEGPEKTGLQRLIVQYGLQNEVFLQGSLSDEEKNRLLEEAILFAAPSRTTAETFGISILEAMGFALPVLTTNLAGGVSVLARQGECGGVMMPGDTGALAKLLAQFMKDPELCKRVGEQNKIFAQTYYSPTAAAQAYRGILDELHRS